MKHLTSILIAGWLLVGLLPPPQSSGPAGVEIREVLGHPYASLADCEQGAREWIRQSAEPLSKTDFFYDAVHVEIGLECQGDYSAIRGTIR
jgi:hypothetical protein